MKKDKQKKVVKIIAIIVAIAALVGIIYAAVTIKKENDELDKHLVELTVSELKEKIENKETFILVNTGSECPHCKSYKPKLKKILKEYNITAYEVVLDKIDNDADSAYLKSVANTSGTPTTVFIKDGEEISTASRLVGDKDKTTIIAHLKRYGYITDKEES